MFRAAPRQQILDVLESSFFGSANYSVQFLTGGKSAVVIHFLPERQFQFVVGRPDADGDYQIVETPGESFTTPQTRYVKEFDNILGLLEAWTKRLREEVVASNPFARELSAFREQMEQKLADMGEELEGFFTSEEADALTRRLDEFASKIDELASKNGELEAVVGNLRQTLADLQTSVNVVDRGTWYRMSAGRMLSGLKAIVTSKEARELALEAAKKFLLEGPK